MSLTVLPVGTGDAFSRYRYGACLAVRAEGRWLLIDCPHPIRKMLHEGAAAAGLPDLDVGDFDALVLTHLHADHASGLEGWGFFHHFALKRPAVVLTHPLVARDLWATLRPSMGVLMHGPERTPVEHHEQDFFEVRSFVDTVELGPFTVRARTTWHHIPTIALRIEAGGKILGYSADTAFDPALLEWLADANLIIHETNLGGAHTPYAALAELPAGLRAKMRLIAFPDAFDPGEWAIAPLAQGELIEC